MIFVIVFEYLFFPQRAYFLVFDRFVFLFVFSSLLSFTRQISPCALSLLLFLIIIILLFLID